MNEEYYVRYLRLPRAVKAVTLPNEDGSYDIYINSALPEATQRRALAHEQRHIRLGHFYDDCTPVAKAEQEAD